MLRSSKYPDSQKIPKFPTVPSKRGYSLEKIKERSVNWAVHGNRSV